MLYRSGYPVIRIYTTSLICVFPCAFRVQLRENLSFLHCFFLNLYWHCYFRSKTLLVVLSTLPAPVYPKFPAAQYNKAIRAPTHTALLFVSMKRTSRSPIAPPQHCEISGAGVTDGLCSCVDVSTTVLCSAEAYRLKL